jgi:ribosomal protein S27E
MNYYIRKEKMTNNLKHKVTIIVKCKTCHYVVKNDAYIDPLYPVQIDHQEHFMNENCKRCNSNQVYYTISV